MARLLWFLILRHGYAYTLFVIRTPFWLTVHPPRTSISRGNYILQLDIFHRSSSMGLIALDQLYLYLVPLLVGYLNEPNRRLSLRLPPTEVLKVETLSSLKPMRHLYPKQSSPLAVARGDAASAIWRSNSSFLPPSPYPLHLLVDFIHPTLAYLVLVLVLEIFLGVSD